MRSRLVDAGRIACFAALMAPSLLASARHDWLTAKVPTGLLDIAILVVVMAATATSPLHPMVATMLGVLFVGALSCSVAAVAFGVAVSPQSMWPVLAALAVGAFACSHLRGVFRFGVPVLLAAAMGAKVTINAIGWLVENPDPLAGTGRPMAGRTYVAAEQWYPSRRYRLIHQLDGTHVRCTLPHVRKDEIHDLTRPEAPPLIVDGGSRHQSVVEGTPWIALSTLWEGWYLLDRRDLQTRKDIYRGDPAGFCFMGVAYDRRRNRIIGLRSDGRLYFFPYPELTPSSEQPLPLPSRELGTWQEQFNDLHLLADRYLLVTEQGAIGWFPPGFVWIDLETGASRHVSVPGSPGGITTPDDGQTFLVVFFPRGILERRRSDDLSVLWSKPLGVGYRYVELLPDHRHVAVANYLTGAVDVVGIDDGTRYGPFQTGPRVEDLAIDPQGIYLDVSQSQAVTRLKLDALLSMPPPSEPAEWFPYWILRPAIVFTILGEGFRELGRVAANWLLVGACLLQFRRSLRPEVS